ncbi:hypothetical protein BHM03_00013087 [Ensete ventricosum]|nr:hypothetical protein BHM03_00013087 [Ensete ventricosum]
MYRLVRAVCTARTSLTGYWYADRPLPAGTVESGVSSRRNEAMPRLPARDKATPAAVDDASPHLLLNLQSSALAATRPLAPSRWIDGFTEVPHLRYHGTAEPMALLSIVLPLHPFLRDR